VATHGEPSDRNAHPHTDCSGRIAVIHNGIVENFQQLRAELEKRDHVIVSETDTELVAHLIEEKGGPLADAVRATVASSRARTRSWCARSTSRTSSWASRSRRRWSSGSATARTSSLRHPAVLQRTRTVLPVDEGEVVEVRASGVTLTDLDGNVKEGTTLTVDWDVARAQKGGFDDFMLKEIHEQPSAIRDTLVGRVDDAGSSPSTSCTWTRTRSARSARSSWWPADRVPLRLVAKYAIEHWTRLPVEIEIASEFRYRDPVLGPTRSRSRSASRGDHRHVEAARYARRQGSRSSP